MQHSDPSPAREAIVVVHVARSWAEAVVVRGLLENCGIASPDLGDGNPSQLPSLGSFLYGIEIYALESQAERARQLIAEYLAGAGEDAGRNDVEDPL